MAPPGRWTLLSVAAGIALALIPVLRSLRSADPAEQPVRKLAPAPSAVVPQKPPEPPEPRLEGLDPLRIEERGERLVSPLPDDRAAELALDPVLQRTARTLLARYRMPEAGIVVSEVKTGKILAYASFVRDDEPYDVNVRARAPAASIFKVVTGAALVEKAGLRAETKQCYHGGRSRIVASELEDDPKRDNACATLAEAMGKSINVVFARLAQKHLAPADLLAMGGALGFGAPIPFPLPNEPSAINVPSEPLEFARTSAGFWNTTLSPLAGAVLAQTIASGGVMLEPRFVTGVLRGNERVWSEPPEPRVLRRAIRSTTAAELTEMMIETVASGSARKAFRDERGRPYLPGIEVAGKTGTLSDHQADRHYTWFVGFAPARAPEIAVSVLVVNTPIWHIKAPGLARDMLRAHFARRGARGVMPPS